MGKGDKKTKRGKIIMKSYGVRRPARKKSAAAVVNTIANTNAENVDLQKPTAKKTTKKTTKKETKE